MKKLIVLIICVFIYNTQLAQNYIVGTQVSKNTGNNSGIIDFNQRYFLGLSSVFFLRFTVKDKNREPIVALTKRGRMIKRHNENSNRRNKH